MSSKIAIISIYLNITLDSLIFVGFHLNPFPFKWDKDNTNSEEYIA